MKQTTILLVLWMMLLKVPTPAPAQPPSSADAPAKPDKAMLIADLSSLDESRARPALKKAIELQDVDAIAVGLSAEDLNIRQETLQNLSKLPAAQQKLALAQALQRGNWESRYGHNTASQYSINAEATEVLKAFGITISADDLSKPEVRKSAAEQLAR